MILEAENLAFSYQKSSRPIFHDVNLHINSGEVLTILGPNGAGKSTLLNCLANIIRPTAGEIRLGGVPIQEMSLRAVARNLGYVPQNHTPAYAYTVKDFVVMGRAPHLNLFQKPSAKDYAIADQVMEDLGIQKFADQSYTQISGGERQQALIARAIVQQPKIIMFDEPTNHLDFGNQLRMVRKIRELAQRGYAVIMTTHMPDHAMMLGDKSAILNRRGELLVGKTEEILTEENLQHIYRVKIRMVYVKEAGRKVCVFEKEV
ncbi:MAG: ABC transporter ATP-binding protein [Lachnospiraceae bacterium]|jgi:iron complex transport system ATP-binding protein